MQPSCKVYSIICYANYNVYTFFAYYYKSNLLADLLLPEGMVFTFTNFLATKLLAILGSLRVILRLVAEWEGAFCCCVFCRPWSDKSRELLLPLSLSFLWFKSFVSAVAASVTVNCLLLSFWMWNFAMENAVASFADPQECLSFLLSLFTTSRNST